MLLLLKACVRLSKMLNEQQLNGFRHPLSLAGHADGIIRVKKKLGSATSK